MIKEFKYIRLVLFLVAATLFACDKEEEPSSELPEWNRNRTTTIQVYSTLAGSSILAGGPSGDDFNAVSNRIRPGLHSVALLHRADASFSGTAPYNPAILMGARSLRVPLFALHRFNGQKAEGTGVLIGHTFVRSETIRVSEGCSFLSVTTRANAAIPMNFGTISFENQEQIDAGSAVVRNNLNDAAVVVGIVRKDLISRLESAFPAQTYRLSTVQGSHNQATQAIFVVSTKKWVLRESTENFIGNSGMAAYDLQIEAL